VVLVGKLRLLLAAAIILLVAANGLLARAWGELPYVYIHAGLLAGAAVLVPRLSAWPARVPTWRAIASAVLAGAGSFAVVEAAYAVSTLLEGAPGTHSALALLTFAAVLALVARGVSNLARVAA
jgi:hypothetical protein